MADDFSKHRDDPMDALGVDNEEFNSYIEQLAYTSPGDYIKIRHKIFATLIKEVVKDINKLVFEAMTEGTVKGTSIISGLTLSAGGEAITNEMRKNLGNPFKPSIPKREANNIAMSIVDNMRQTLGTLVVDRIMNKNQLYSVLGNAQRQADMKLGGN